MEEKIAKLIKLFGLWFHATDMTHQVEKYNKFQLEIASMVNNGKYKEEGTSRQL